MCVSFQWNIDNAILLIKFKQLVALFNIHLPTDFPVLNGDHPQRTTD